MNIFILGCQRSGTTLLRMILNKHSRLSILPETHVYTIFKNKRIRLNNNIFVENYFELLPIYNSGWEIEENQKIKEYLKSKLVHGVFNSEGDFLKEILNNYREYSSTSIVGEKTPPHIYFIDEINEAIPDSKFIVIHRDPRAVAFSERNKLNKIGPERNYSVLKVIVRWISSFYIEKRFNHDNKFKLQFENLISDPEGNTKELCRFINIDFESEMLNVGVVNSSFEQDGSNGFTEEKIHQWINSMDLAEGLLIEYCLNKEMNILGYSPYFSNLPDIPLVKKIYYKTLAKSLRIAVLLIALNKKFLKKYYSFK